jgi:hypothetical protein
MMFDKSKGFCNGAYIQNGGCEFTFHSVKHTRDEVTINDCKTCSCPLARSHRQQYSAKRRGILNTE